MAQQLTPNNINTLRIHVGMLGVYTQFRNLSYDQQYQFIRSLPDKPTIIQYYWMNKEDKEIVLYGEEA